MRRLPLVLALAVGGVLLYCALRSDPQSPSRPQEIHPESFVTREERIERLQAEVVALRSELACVGPLPALHSDLSPEIRLRELVKRARDEWRRGEWERHVGEALRLEMPYLSEKLALRRDQGDQVCAILREASLPAVEAVLAFQGGRLNPTDLERLVDPAQHWDDVVDRKLLEVLTPAQFLQWQAYKKELAYP